MKQTVFVALSIVIVAACLCLAIIKYHDRRVTAQVAQNSAVMTANNTLKEHDAVNATAIANANKVVAAYAGQKVTLCAQIKTAKLVQPLCQ